MENHISAHRFSLRNRRMLRTPQTCGCFYCQAIFNSQEIFFWIDNEQTALCPRCMIDSVIGASSGAPITPAFLKQMHDYWFASSKKNG